MPTPTPPKTVGEMPKTSLTRWLMSPVCVINSGSATMETTSE